MSQSPTDPPPPAYPKQAASAASELAHRLTSIAHDATKYEKARFADNFIRALLFAGWTPPQDNP